MEIIEMKNYLFHGIIDWDHYDDVQVEAICFDKFLSILEHGYIYRPMKLREMGITKFNYANVFTAHFTFLACHPESEFANFFKKDFNDDNGYLMATSTAYFGFLIDPLVLKELPVYSNAFTDKEIMILDDIDIKKYVKGIYINADKISIRCFDLLLCYQRKYHYHFKFYDLNGEEITDYRSLDYRKKR